MRVKKLLFHGPKWLSKIRLAIFHPHFSGGVRFGGGRLTIMSTGLVRVNQPFIWEMVRWAPVTLSRCAAKKIHQGHGFTHEKSMSVSFINICTWKPQQPVLNGVW